MKNWFKSYGAFLLVILVIVGWSVFFYFISPTTVVAKIGLENSYIIAFILGIVCGFSSLTGTTFYVAIVALTQGGADPLMIGLSGGVGVCISDAMFYFVINKGTYLVDRHWAKVSKSINYWLELVPDAIIYPLIFLYSTFAPIPNDIILAILAVGKVPFKKIAPFLFAGDIAFTLILAYLSN